MSSSQLLSGWFKSIGQDAGGLSPPTFLFWDEGVWNRIVYLHVGGDRIVYCLHEGVWNRIVSD